MDDTRGAVIFLTGWTSTEAETETNTSSYTLGDLYSPMPVSVVPSAMALPADTALSAELINKELKWLFVLHTYGFACLFFVLAFYTFFSILNLRSLTSNRSCMTTINVFVCVLGVVRSCCLFIDPYLLRETLPRSLGAVLWDLGYPSVMAAFSFVQLAFLQLTQVHVGPANMRKKSFLSVIIAGHLCCVVGSDVVAAFHDHLVGAKYVVQALFLGWGGFLCCTFLYAGYKVMALLKLMPKDALLGPQPGCASKGIMQLSAIAPYTNLASCLTAALMPTLLGPSSSLASRGLAADADADADVKDAGPAARHPGIRTPPTAPLDAGVRPVASKWSPGCRRKTRSPSTPVAVSCRRSSSPQARSRRRSELSAATAHSVTFSMDLPQGQAQGQHEVPPNTDAAPPRSPRLTKPMPFRAEPRTQLNCVTAQLNDPIATSKLLNTETLESCKSSVISSEVNHSVLAGAKLTPKNTASSDEEAMIELLPQRQPRTTDLTLDSILNHIAYVNRTSGQQQVSMESSEGKSQVRRVLHVTYATALLGLLLCVAQLCQLLVPMVMLASTSVWPWFCVQTVSRAIEFAMGCAMANITKQPANTRYHQRPFGHPGHRREPHFL